MSRKKTRRRLLWHSYLYSFLLCWARRTKTWWWWCSSSLGLLLLAFLRNHHPTTTQTGFFLDTHTRILPQQPLLAAAGKTDWWHHLFFTLTDPMGLYSSSCKSIKGLSHIRPEYYQDSFPFFFPFSEPWLKPNPTSCCCLVIATYFGWRASAAKVSQGTYISFGWFRNFQHFLAELPAAACPFFAMIGNLSRKWPMRWCSTGSSNLIDQAISGNHLFFF